MERYYSYASEPRFQTGVNILMVMDSGGGVYNMTCFLARQFRRQHIPFCIVPISGNTLSQDFEDLIPYLRPHVLYPVNIWSVGIPFVKDHYAHHSEIFNGRYNVNLTTWELPFFPERLHNNFAPLDEIWTVSEFNCETLKKATQKPVRLIDFGLHILPDAGLFYGRRHFGLPRNNVLFLINFEFTSSRIRKNPEAAIEAFRRAAPHMGTDATLVLHARFNPLHGSYWKQRHEQFKEEIRTSAVDMRIIDIDNMPYSQQIGLKRACDCYVSLHRAEGYGLSCAEMLDVGNWVVMTGFSGNTEVLYPKRWNAAQVRSVDYHTVPVTAEDYGWVMAGEESFQYWAEADIDDAAAKMIEVYQAVRNRK